MNESEFRRRLADAKDSYDMARVMYDVLDDAAFDPDIPDEDMKNVPSMVKRIIDSGLYDINLTDMPGFYDGFSVSPIRYLKNEVAVEAAEIIFGRCGLPRLKSEKPGTDFPPGRFFMDDLMDNICVDDEISLSVARVYLLAASYYEGDSYIRFSENVGRGVFDYGPRDVVPSFWRDGKPLTKEVLRNIDRMDFIIEQIGTTQRKLHIFEKNTKVKIAEFV